MGLPDLISQVLPVISTVGASGLGLTYWLDRRTRRAEASRLQAQGGKADADAQAVISGSALKWAQRADTQAEVARGRADAAEAKAALSESRIDELEGQVNDLQEKLELCRSQLKQITAQLTRCTGGPPCPVRAQLLPLPERPPE